MRQWRYRKKHHINIGERTVMQRKPNKANWAAMRLLARRPDLGTTRRDWVSISASSNIKASVSSHLAIRWMRGVTAELSSSIEQSESLGRTRLSTVRPRVKVAFTGILLHLTFTTSLSIRHLSIYLISRLALILYLKPMCPPPPSISHSLYQYPVFTIT